MRVKRRGGRYATRPTRKWTRTRARVRSNLSRSDPTGTIGIQRSYIADMNRRWKKVARAIQELLVTHDAMRLSPVKSPFPGLPVAASLATNQTPFVFRRDVAGKTEDFNLWLNQKMDEDVLEIGGRAVDGRITRNSKWQDQYVRSSYGRGLGHAQRAMKQQGIPFDSRAAADLFNAPIHRDTLALMYTRQFSDLQGITQATSTQISRVLTEGLATGKGPRDIARTMRTAISTIGVNRSRTLARTEIIRVHAESTLNRYEDAGMKEVKVLAEFATGRDDRVCPICQALETGQPLPLEEARGRIPVHANCRCAWLPSQPGVKQQPRLAPPPGSSGPLGKFVTGDKAKSHMNKNYANAALKGAQFKAVDSYQNGAYHGWNKHKRGTKVYNPDGQYPGMIKEQLAGIGAVESAIARSPAIGRDVRAFRGVNPTDAPDVLKLKVGDVMVDKGFVSTSLDPKIAVDFSSGGSLKTVFEIGVPKKTKGLWMEKAIGDAMEDEFLMDGGRFRVVRVRTMAGEKLRLQPGFEDIPAEGYGSVRTAVRVITLMVEP